MNRYFCVRGLTLKNTSKTKTVVENAMTIRGIYYKVADKLLTIERFSLKFTPNR